MSLVQSQAARHHAPLRSIASRIGAVNWTVLAWAVGIPIPLVLILGLMRGCS